MSLGVRVVALVLVASAAAAPGASAAPTKVLVVHAYGEEAPFRTQFDAGFDRVVDPMLADGSLELYTETVDAYRFPGTAHLEAMSEYLHSKYADRRPDVIVAVLDSALEFVLSHRGEVFPDVPVVAMLTRPPSHDLPPDVIASWLGSPYQEVAAIAERLDPGLRHLAVIDGDLADRAGGAGTDLDEELAELNRRVSTIQLHDLRLNELLGRVRVLPPQTAIVFVRQLIGDDGAPIHRLQSLRAGTRVAKVPVFATEPALLGHGVVGGAMLDVEADGAALARSAVELAGAGVAEADRPHPFQGVITPMFDGKEL